MFGKKKRMIEQQRQRIAELEEQVKGLTAQNDSFNARIAEVEQRESGIGRAISEATVTADRMIGDAQRKAGAMLEQAQQDTDAAKRDAERPEISIFDAPITDTLISNTPCRYYNTAARSCQPTIRRCAGGETVV